MKRDADGGDYYTLSTGRRFYANNGILGLCGDTRGDQFENPRTLYNGYDGTTHPEASGGGFSRQERAEIAEFMIARWRKWGGLE